MIKVKVVYSLYDNKVLMGQFLTAYEALKFSKGRYIVIKEVIPV